MLQQRARVGGREQAHQAILLDRAVFEQPEEETYGDNFQTHSMESNSVS